MRNFERQADNYVFTLFASARPLISTLRKIALTSGQSPDKPNWHHFSIRERMDNLERCERDRGWIAHHDGLLRRGMAVYMVGMISVGLVGYSVTLGEGGRKMSGYLAHLEERWVLRAIEKAPERPELYSRLGYLYHNGGNYEGAVQAYMESLTVAQENPEALNNLAWLYATCEDARYRDPEQAVYLAEKAVALDTRPHILDTLAESYYVNGQVEEAAAAGTYALRLAEGNRSYYRRQLDKFTQARMDQNPL
jgi:tetratricopeptide (TPR) repeat protein